MTGRCESAVSPPCGDFHILVERIADGFAVYPIGRLAHSGRWLVDQRVLQAVEQLAHGSLYVDCDRMMTVGTESLANMVSLCRKVISRGGRVVLCNLQSHLREFFTADHHNYLLSSFAISGGGVPEGMFSLSNPSWITPTIVDLATAICERQAFARLSGLADALEEAGCTHADILDHCRGPGRHVRDCWALSLVLGGSKVARPGA